MPRYFFDSGDPNDVIQDDVGIECTGPEEARRAGIDGLRDLARDALTETDGQRLFVEIRDEDGDKLLRLSISVQVTPLA
jgi:hypothetical protein